MHVCTLPKSQKGQNISACVKLRIGFRMCWGNGWRIKDFRSLPRTTDPESESSALQTAGKIFSFRGNDLRCRFVSYILLAFLQIFVCTVRSPCICLPQVNVLNDSIGRSMERCNLARNYLVYIFSEIWLMVCCPPIPKGFLWLRWLARGREVIVWWCVTYFNSHLWKAPGWRTYSKNWNFQYSQVVSENIYKFRVSFGCLDCDRPPESSSEVFWTRSNVEFRGASKFPVGICRFHFERVETLVFLVSSCRLATWTLCACLLC